MPQIKRVDACHLTTYKVGVLVLYERDERDLPLRQQTTENGRREKWMSPSTRGTAPTVRIAAIDSRSAAPVGSGLTTISTENKSENQQRREAGRLRRSSLAKTSATTKMHA